MSLWGAEFFEGWGKIKRMTFFETFVATMAGALAGAVAAWLFALELRRRDRETREADLAATMRPEWAALTPLFRAHARALSSVPPALPFRLLRRWQLRHARRSLRALNMRLIAAAAVARGADSAFVTVLGQAANAHRQLGPARTDALTLAPKKLIELATCEDSDLKKLRAQASSEISAAVQRVWDAR